jgi:hypothetical protein
VVAGNAAGVEVDYLIERQRCTKRRAIAANVLASELMPIASTLGEGSATTSTVRAPEGELGTPPLLIRAAVV